MKIFAYVFRYIFKILCFLALAMIFQKLGRKIHVLFLIAVFILFFIARFITSLVFKLKYKNCPKCGAKMIEKQRSAPGDPKKGTYLMSFFIGVEATEYWTVMCCENCGYEIAMDPKKR